MQESGVRARPARTSINAPSAVASWPPTMKQPALTVGSINLTRERITRVTLQIWREDVGGV